MTTTNESRTPSIALVVGLNWGDAARSFLRRSTLVAIGLISPSCALDQSRGDSTEFNDNHPAHSVQAVQIRVTSPQSLATPAKRTHEDPHSIPAILGRTAAVVEGVIQDVAYTYDEKNGPRTINTLKLERVHAGTVPGKTIKLSQLGGPLNDGRVISTSLSEDLVVGERYVVFLSSDAWFVTPFSAETLRVRDVAGREVLTSSDGHVLKRIVPDGMHFGSDAIPVDAGMRQATAAHAPPSEDLRPEALNGALTRADFKRLLVEAIDIEGVAPAGRFSETPSPTRDRWNIIPTEPPSGNGGVQ